MTQISRRTFALSAVAGTALAACSNGIGGAGGQRIDARVDETLQHMYDRYPGTRQLASDAAGLLIMPLVTEVGLWVGGSYGQGALRINGTSVDYYSIAGASAGFQIGAQQFSHVLFFMTPESLQEFRQSSGWVAGADLEYAVSTQSDMLRADSTTSLAPVIAVVFAQAGLRVGATLEGAKYTRIIP